MDNIENLNDPIEQENTEPAEYIEANTEPETQSETAPAQPRQEVYSYRGTGTGRKESPYANSPYVMHHRTENDHGTYGQYQNSPNAGRYQTQYEMPRKPKAKKKTGGAWKKIVSAVAALALVIGSCGITAALVNDYWEDRTDIMENRFQKQIQDLQRQIDEQSPAITGNSVSMEGGYSAGQVYAQNVHSVVLIESTVTASMYGQTATGVSSGSGFIVTQDGYVVTNYHVIEGASAVSVVLYNGTRYAAQVAGYDDTNDVAVLKIEATGLQHVTIGSSSDLIVGDQVVAIGNPLGELTSTLTVGYVSAKERDVTTEGTIINMLQTDCAINSGNSGGPLFNMKGEVVGITTAKYSGNSSSGASIEGIGFAIPIDDVAEGIEELMQFGYIKSAYMGVVVQNMDPNVADAYGLPLGVQVVSVEEGGAAQRAGIQAKDIILAVDDARIEGLTDLTRALRNYEPGDQAWITVSRSGAERKILITFDERPQNTGTVTPESGNGSQMPEGDFDEWYDYFAPFFGNGG